MIFKAQIIVGARNKGQGTREKTLTHAPCCLTLLALFLCFPLPARAAQSDYELLVQRNLEFREKLNALEQKYAQLENERNVLIGHVRDLQLEREKLAQDRKDVEAGRLRYSEFQKAIEQTNEQLGVMTEERDKFRDELAEMKKSGKENQSAVNALESEKAGLGKRLKGLNEEIAKVTEEKDELQKELAGIKKARGGNQAAIKTLESEKAGLDKRLEKAGLEMDAVMKERDALREDLAEMKKGQANDRAVVKTLESERTALRKQVEEINKRAEFAVTGEDQSRAELGDARKTLETIRSALKALESEKGALVQQIAEIQLELKKSQAALKDLVIERAFLRAREAELKTRDRDVLVESDRLKADVQRLIKVNEALKDADQKWQQAKHDLDALRAGSRKMEIKNKKLENKLGKMKALETRSRKQEEELKALRMLQREREAVIGKLSSEKSALDARLAKFTAPTGVSPAAYARRKGVLSPANKQRLDMHFNLAVTYDKTKMYKAEEREYMECLRIDPADANVHYNLGILYDDKLNDNAKAIKHYQKYLQLRPTGEDTEQVRQWIMYAEQQQRL